MSNPERSALIHCARVYIAEARRRRKQSFGFTLLNWAGNKRRAVFAMDSDPDPSIEIAPIQLDLFGAA